MSDRGDPFPSDVGDSLPISPSAGLQEIDFYIPKPIKSEPLKTILTFAPQEIIDSEPELPRQVYYGVILELQDRGPPIKFSVQLQDGKIVTAYSLSLMDDQFFRPLEPCIVVAGQAKDEWWLVALPVYNDKSYLVVSNGVADQTIAATTEATIELTTLISTTPDESIKLVGNEIEFTEDGLYEIDFRVTTAYSSNAHTAYAYHDYAHSYAITSLASGHSVVYDGVYGDAEYFEAVTGGIKVLKEGMYLLSANLVISSHDFISTSWLEAACSPSTVKRVYMGNDQSICIHFTWTGFANVNTVFDFVSLTGIMGGLGSSYNIDGADWSLVKL